jgi:GNAT superfamily N-acetyltransferase
MDRAIAIRPMTAADSVQELTALLHRAYASLGSRGLNYTAVDQSCEETSRRIAQGECVIAVKRAAMVGTIIARGGPNKQSSSAWYRQPYVASAHQLAVEPELQGSGIGSSLVAWAEAWARTRGYVEIAVDTAEPAEELIAFYSHRGYRFIEHAQWPGKRYRSVILSKSLAHAP